MTDDPTLHGVCAVDDCRATADVGVCPGRQLRSVRLMPMITCSDRGATV